jgi:hypothetical protein
MVLRAGRGVVSREQLNLEQLPLLFTPAIQNGYTGRPNRRLYLIRKTELGDYLVVRYGIRKTYTGNPDIQRG